MAVNQQELLFMNGISGVTGYYSVPPITLGEFADVIRGRTLEADHLADLEKRKFLHEDSFAVQARFGDGSDLAKVRWGIIFPAQADPAQVDAVLAALDPLIKLRESQMGNKPAEIYRGGRGVRWVTPPDGSPVRPETKSEWLSRQGAGPGQVNPDIVPFYLMIVADPNSIPFIFQYELDVQYAVGRIYFQTIDEYARYAASVVSAAKLSLERRAVFFGVANPGDRATELSYNHLVKPLVNFVNDPVKTAGLNWHADLVDGQDASRSALSELLGGSKAPPLVFTASHGIDFPYMHPDQYRYQGGIVCRDWNGPNVEATRQHYLTAEDIPDLHNLTGSIVFHFACFGAGTPYWDEHAAPRNRNRKALAGRPFLAALPNRLLTLPGGGALAVIGHIDRAWNYSFQWSNIQEQTGAYEGILFQLMCGKQVGLALEAMNDRYSEIATQLTTTMEDLKFPPYSEALLARASFEFASNNDSRAYAIIGDPAVSIPIALPEVQPAERLSINLATPTEGKLPIIFNPESLVRFNWVERAALDQENQMLGFSPTAGSPPQGQPAQNDGLPPRAPVQNIQVQTPPAVSAAASSGQQPGSPAASAQPQGRPFSTPVDGLAFALQVYSSSEEVSFSLGVEGVPFNLVDDAKEKIKQVVVSLNAALSNLAKKMEEVTGDLAELEIISSVVDDLDTFDPKTGDRRIITRIAGDGDIQLYLPRSGGKIDEDLLALHQSMVKQALTNRLEVARALAEMIAGLFGGQK